MSAQNNWERGSRPPREQHLTPLDREVIMSDMGMVDASTHHLYEQLQQLEAAEILRPYQNASGKVIELAQWGAAREAAGRTVGSTLAQQGFDSVQEAA